MAHVLRLSDGGATHLNSPERRPEAGRRWSLLVALRSTASFVAYIKIRRKNHTDRERALKAAGLSEQDAHADS
jgi:hypothetical protein